MSSEKYDAITEAGIDVMQRVSLPDSFVPADAVVEITAKISAGYHSEHIDTTATANELRSLGMIRERCSKIFALSQAGKSKHFTLDLSKLDGVVDFVHQVTTETYGNSVSNIPYHSRWRHFNKMDIDAMVSTWHCDSTERVRRLMDLVTISVLLDAGAGAQWHYIDEHGHRQERSEGLAIATFEMFRDGAFSSDAAVPHRVNGLGLTTLTVKAFSKGLQISEANPITGLEGRFELLKRVGRALQSNHEYFGHEVCRPGNILDFVLAAVDPATRTVSLKVLWQAVIEGLEDVWPQHLSGARRGDVWSYSLLKEIGKNASDLIPFHKLAQHLRRRDRALHCCASTVASSDAVQRLCTLDLCARVTLCLDALFNTPLALSTRFEDNAGVVTLYDTGHGVFQLVQPIRRVGGEIRVLVGKGFESSEPIECFIAKTAVALNSNTHKDCVRLMRMLRELFEQMSDRIAAEVVRSNIIIIARYRSVRRGIRS